MAGKKKAAAKRKSETIQVRLTPTQYREVAAAAEAMGLSLSSYVRFLVLRQRDKRNG